MKKLLSVVLLAASIVTGLPNAQAEEAEEPSFSPNIRQQVAARSIYANARIKDLCEKWPGCAQWAVSHHSSFRIVDAEKEYWIAGWGKKGAVWFQNLYLQTVENDQKWAYKFRQNMSGYETQPYQINKFPGHPPVAPAVKTHHKKPTALDKCMAFPNCAKWRKDHRLAIDNAVITQFITRFDTKGNAVWNRDLYIWAASNGWDRKQRLLFHAYQKEAGSSWTYEPNPRSF